MWGDGESGSVPTGSRLTFQLVPADSVNTDYRISTAEVLGTGVGGEVVVGENRLTGISYAIKTVVKGANKKAQERSKTEVALMKAISHPHICKRMHQRRKEAPVLTACAGACPNP